MQGRRGTQSGNPYAPLLFGGCLQGQARATIDAFLVNGGRDVAECRCRDGRLLERHRGRAGRLPQEQSQGFPRQDLFTQFTGVHGIFHNLVVDLVQVHAGTHGRMQFSRTGQLDEDHVWAPIVPNQAEIVRGIHYKSDGAQLFGGVIKARCVGD